MRRNTKAHPNQFQTALEILAKRGHIIGEITAIAGQPYVTVDGELRTHEQVFDSWRITTEREREV